MKSCKKLTKKEQRFISDGKLFIALVTVITILATMAHFMINFYYPDNQGTGMGKVIGVSIVVLFAVFIARNYEIWMKN